MFVVAAEYTLSVRRISELIGAAIAVAILVILAKHPVAAAATLVVFVPLQTVGLALLFHFGMPAGIVRSAGSIKELCGLALLAAAFIELRAGRQQIDRVDRAVLAYVGVVTFYLLAPHVLSPLAPSAWSPRILAWRTDCGYPLLFLAVRHIPISRKARERIVSTVMGVSALLIAAGIYQLIAPTAFSKFILTTADVPRYLVSIIHIAPNQLSSILFYIIQTHPLRISSLVISPFDFGDFLIIPLALVAEGITRGDRRVRTFLFLFAGLAALFFTEVRADALGVLIVLVVAAAPAPRRAIGARLRLLVALGIAAAVVIPSLAGTRFSGAQGGSASSSAHIREIGNGISIATQHPFGLGLGNQPETSVRFSTLPGGNAVISDNSTTQVADELGVEGLIPWLLMVGLILLEVRKRVPDSDALTAGAGLAFVGILIAGQYHHVFVNLTAPWPLMVLLGLALPVPGVGTERLEVIVSTASGR